LGAQRTAAKVLLSARLCAGDVADAVDVSSVSLFFFLSVPNRYYEPAVHYLDIKQRIAVLNKRLNILQELLQMLRDEIKHKEARRLEARLRFAVLLRSCPTRRLVCASQIIVVILIVVDIVMELLSIIVEWLKGCT
jgi:hypothetical protein